MANNRIAWIASNQQQIRNGLSGALENEIGCEVAAFSLSSLLKGDIPCSQPQWIFLDLLDNDTWNKFPLINKRLGRQFESDVAQIGIVQHGYPLKWFAEADRYLATSLKWPNGLGNLPATLARAQKSAKMKATLRSGGLRELSVRGRTFSTYTPSLFPLFEKIERAARHDFTILLVGETGTGKTTFARIVHDLSSRANERFLTVACGAMPNELMGSELFGHMRGAFTGADREKEGKFDAAHKGTLLLDEIDVLDLEQQANLLRVIETGEFEPVGSNDTRSVDVRVVGASNQSLEDAIDDGGFRADLYFRLNEVKFEIPPLRHRQADIVPLALLMMQECCDEKQLTVECVDPDYLDLLRHYSWPGNVRELRNEIRHSVLFCADGVISPDLFSEEFLAEAKPAFEERLEDDFGVGLSNEVAKTEQEAIEEMLLAHDFNRAATARALGISRVTLYNKIRKYRIKMRDRRGVEE